MGNFILPDGPPVPPPLPLDPRVAREEKIANDTRVESELNRFIASRQDAMFNNPDAFYRTQGEAAIHAAPVATKNLEQLRSDLLDGLANDYQRKRLGAALDAQMQLTRQQMARHVAEQSLVWQRGVAQDRIDILAREAALHHNDDDLIDGIGAGAANAARARARVGGGPIDADRENAAAATARSRIVSSAIQARLDKGHTEGAAALFERTREQLDPAHAAPLQRQIETVQRFDAAKDYARQLVPTWSNASHAELDAQHAVATQQNRADNADDPEYQADVQHVLDVQHGLQKRRLDQQLQANGEASDPTPPGQVVLLPVPGSGTMEPSPQPPPEQQPPDQSPNPPPAAPEQQPDPPSDGPVDTAPPVSPEQDPDESTEDPKGSPGLAVIEKLPAGSIAWPRFGVPAEPMPGSLPATAAQLATRVAANAPGAVTTAALAAGAAATALLTPRNFQGGTIELGDGLRAQWVPGQRSATIERRTGKGLFGSEIGAKWEELPVDATYEAGPDGRPTLFVDPQALKAALAVPATASGDRGVPPNFPPLLGSVPFIYEIRISLTKDGGTTIEHRSVTEEQIRELCPNYFRYKEIGNRAMEEVRALGLSDPAAIGLSVHQLAKLEISRISQALLTEWGIAKLTPELGLLRGVPFQHRPKGSSVLDVYEANKDKKRVCVYDFKTGNPTLRKEARIRYLREAQLYATGYTHIYVMPISIDRQ